MIATLRLYSGFILLFYVGLHLLNHALGIISIEAMNNGLRLNSLLWHSLLGTVLLYGSFALHASLGFYSLYQRRSLKMPMVSQVQLIMGFLIPLLLATHISATRALSQRFDVVSDYYTVLPALWVFIPEYGVMQAIAVIVVWAHAMIGMHMWLRLKPWYDDARAWLLGGAVILPVAALCGYVSAGMEIIELVAVDGWVEAMMASYGRRPEMVDFIYTLRDGVIITIISVLIAVLAARWIRQIAARRRRRAVIRYAPGDISLALEPGSTVLECLQAAGVGHAAVCGGKGRCSTCRVRVESGAEALPDPDENERRVLERVGLQGPVRLACQVRPSNDLTLVALIPPESTVDSALRGRGQRQGKELTAAYLFVDLRGSTKLSEDRLPFDVVFILNQFFAELSSALRETNGHYAQFNGDGLMAIYGLEQDIATASWQAVKGAQAMFRRIEELNHRLGEQLQEPLKIGIGIHAGEAIVGTMGPPTTPIVSALGDNVNVAARLESQSKEFGVPLVISAQTAEYASMNVDGLDSREVAVKGRDQPVRVYAIAEPYSLSP